MTAAAGLLGTNVMHFARLLRRAGLPVGPAEVIAAGQALELIEIGDRPQVRSALRGLMVHRHEHIELFDHAFDLFWRDPSAGQYAAALALLEGSPPPSRRRSPAPAASPKRWPRRAPSRPRRRTRPNSTPS